MKCRAIFLCAFAIFVMPRLLMAQDQKTGSPTVFFGNGLKAGWVGQKSAILWTRTTSHPEMNGDGHKFIVPKGADRRRIERSQNEALQTSSQLPDGVTLNEMLGACPGTGADVTLRFYPEGREAEAIVKGPVVTRAESDFTVRWNLSDLQPGTRYIVELTAASGQSETPARIRGQFRTAPASDQRVPVRFCMTTCHDFDRRDGQANGHRIYPSMAKQNPDFVVHAGDVEYYDHPRPFAWTVPLMRFHWNRFFALPANRDFYSNHAAYFLKDDHDTLKNDCWPGQTYGSVTFEQGRRIFDDEQFPRGKTPYQTVRWGNDLQIWLVEGRNFRSANNAPDGSGKTIWGDEQKKWFFKTVAESDATFKILFSPTPICGPDRGGKRDNHANPNFKTEGDELRQFISKQENLIILCGDRHWQYVTHLAESNLWELCCGPGSEEHQLGWKKGDRRDVHQFLRVAGGFLSGEVVSTEGAASLYLRHHDVAGNVVNEQTFDAKRGQ